MNDAIDAAKILRNLSPQDFLAFGTNQIGYMKPVEAAGRPAIAIYGADGTFVAVEDNRAKAIVSARQSGIEVANIH